jgi:hypothetical protein
VAAAASVARLDSSKINSLMTEKNIVALSLGYERWGMDTAFRTAMSP